MLIRRKVHSMTNTYNQCQSRAIAIYIGNGDAEIFFNYFYGLVDLWSFYCPTLLGKSRELNY